MAPKVFLTGATGFIGGDILYRLVKTHPDWELTCIVRNTDKGAKVAAEYPRIRLVYGDNESLQLLEEEAVQADIVIHTSASDDDVPSAMAIAKGLRKSGGHYIHTSGFLLLTMETITNDSWGELSPKIYDDWDNVHELLNMHDDAPHRLVDKIVLAPSPENVKVAIVNPSVVYGLGRGPDKKVSFPIWSSFIKHGRAIRIGRGENIWNTIHVQDLSSIYLLLAEAAVNGTPVDIWNERGYYLAENGSFVAKDMLQLAAKIGHKQELLSSAEVDQVSPDEAEQIMVGAKAIFGSTSRGHAVRATKLLGWKPVNPTFEDEIEKVMLFEAQSHGLVKGHADKVEEHQA